MSISNEEKPVKHYVDNDKFLAAIIDFKDKLKIARDTDGEKPIMSEYLGDCFYKIAENYSYTRSFIQYPFREDMVMDAVYFCVKYIDTFNPEKTKNPFSYFTTTCHNAFLQKIEKEKKYLYTKYKAMENNEIFEEDYNDDGRKKTISSTDSTSTDYVQIKRQEFVEKFEERMEKKKLEKLEQQKLEEDKKE